MLTLTGKIESPATGIGFGQALLQVPVARQVVRLFLCKDDFQHFSVQPIHPDASHGRVCLRTKWDHEQAVDCSTEMAARST